MTEHVEVARLLLDPDVKASMGLRTQAARLLLTGQRPTVPDGCLACGGEIVRSPRGRPRRYCSDPCRWKASRKKREKQH